MLTHALIKNGGILGAFALVTTGLITTINLWTAPVITEQEQKKLQQTLQAVFPSNEYNNNLIADCISVIDQDVFGSNDSKRLYRARYDKQPKGIIYQTTAPDGYSGGIELLVGVTVDNTLSAVRVTKHNETPGLGDKIDLRVDDWILSFNGKDLSVPEAFAVKKDGGEFDQFTGATITPRATVAAVAKVLAYHQQQQKTLWAKTADCED